MKLRILQVSPKQFRVQRCLFGLFWFDASTNPDYPALFPPLVQAESWIALLKTDLEDWAKAASFKRRVVGEYEI